MKISTNMMLRFSVELEMRLGKQGLRVVGYGSSTIAWDRVMRMKVITAQRGPAER